MNKHSTPAFSFYQLHINKFFCAEVTEALASSVEETSLPFLYDFKINIRVNTFAK